jgi:dephospho-CoA kinase
MIIALTGGIGSGKSVATKQFATLGVPIVDADVIAHELTAIGAPLLKDIAHEFGNEFINFDGSLNRIKLRDQVFKQPADRLKLEAILHPAIHKEALNRLVENEGKLHPAYQILVVPLLFENNLYQGVADKSLVIDCDESMQFQRVIARSHLNQVQVKEMMAAQVSRETRLDLADEVISNNGTLTELQIKITTFHKKLIKTCIVSK